MTRPKRIRLPPPTGLSADMTSWVRDVTRTLDDDNFSLRTVESDYTMEAGLRIAQANASNITITLPQAANLPGKMVSVKNASTGNILVRGTAGQTIDSSKTMTLSFCDAITVYSDGSNWQIV